MHIIRLPADAFIGLAIAWSKQELPNVREVVFETDHQGHLLAVQVMSGDDNGIESVVYKS